MKLTKIPTLDIILAVAVLEMVALVWRRLFFNLGIHSVLAGFLIGFLTMLPLFFIFNRIRFGFRIFLDEKKYVINKVSLLLPSFYSGLFLMLVFLLNELLLGINEYLMYFTMAFAPALLITLLINFVPYKIKINDMILTKVGYSAALYVGLFELFIVPMMSMTIRINPYVADALIGLLSGFFGAFIAILFVNWILEYYQLEFNLK